MTIGTGVSVGFANEFFNPTVPVEIPVHGFNHGQRLRLVIMPTDGPSGRFVVNLRTPQDIVFHFNPRFDEQAVVANSTHHGSWQHEERSSGEFPFHHNHVYTLEFVSNGGQVSVYVNGRHFTDFVERAPGHSVNLIEINGDCHVHSAHVTH